MRILILGGGYAGLRAALDLAHARRDGALPPGARVELVERADCQQLIFWMHQVAAGTLTPDDACIDYARLPLEEIGLHRAEVHAVDPDGRRVITSAGELDYDILILALGATTALPPIPGLAEHAHTLRDREGAEALYRAMERAYGHAGQAADREDQARWATVAVAGGGFTGCQLAGELAHRLPDLADRHGVPLTRVRLILMESQGRLLPNMAPCHARSARRILEEKGVEVWTGAALERVGEGTVVAGGTGLACGTLVWAGGIRGPSLLTETGLELDGNGRVRVDRFLRSVNHPDIRAAGDCAVRADDPSAEATASEAIQQGRYLARAVRQELAGHAPFPYRPNRLGLLVALGDGDAVGTVGPLPLAGRTAGLIKNAAERTYPDTLTGTHPEAFLDPDFFRPA